MLQRAFPLHYADLIVYHADRWDLDPYLVAAVIAVESSFRPEVVSHQGAIGLMQLMPDTATWAGQMVRSPVETEHLLDPETNIALGSWYLQYLRAQFSTTASWLAAYNAGQGNVRRWLEQGIWDGSLATVDNVPFPETRRYLRRVYYTWEFYENIYPDIWNTVEEAKLPAPRD